MSHTPGPWNCHISDDHGGVYEIGVREIDGSAWPLELSDENARLIAAAPDLFDALQDALEHGLELGSHQRIAAQHAIVKSHWPSGGRGEVMSEKPDLETISKLYREACAALISAERDESQKRTAARTALEHLVAAREAMNQAQCEWVKASGGAYWDRDKCEMVYP